MFERMYLKENYKITKSVRIDERLYEEVRKLSKNDYDASLSDIINIGIEEMLINKRIEPYEKWESKKMCYKTMQLRKKNYEDLEKIKKETGVSITRLINIAIKELLDKCEKKVGGFDIPTK